MATFFNESELTNRRLTSKLGKYPLINASTLTFANKQSVKSWRRDVNNWKIIAKNDLGNRVKDEYRIDQKDERINGQVNDHKRGEDE